VIEDYQSKEEAAKKRRMGELPVNMKVSKPRYVRQEEGEDSYLDCLVMSEAQSLADGRNKLINYIHDDVVLLPAGSFQQMSRNAVTLFYDKGDSLRVMESLGSNDLMSIRHILTSTKTIRGNVPSLFQMCQRTMLYLLDACMVEARGLYEWFNAMAVCATFSNLRSSIGRYIVRFLPESLSFAWIRSVSEHQIVDLFDCNREWMEAKYPDMGFSGGSVKHYFCMAFCSTNERHWLSLLLNAYEASAKHPHTFDGLGNFILYRVLRLKIPMFVYKSYVLWSDCRDTKLWDALLQHLSTLSAGVFVNSNSIGSMASLAPVCKRLYDEMLDRLVCPMGPKVLHTIQEELEDDLVDLDPIVNSDDDVAFV